MTITEDLPTGAGDSTAGTLAGSAGGASLSAEGVAPSTEHPGSSGGQSPYTPKGKAMPTTKSDRKNRTDFIKPNSL